ncbi:MAG: HlyD family efflux transporter periplasmic adaptor subunit [Bacteroidetes bacterium]|nr:MAG: HlyD family efflux transporter periplasmic adaptor subunit [Bacteroidota bacterium]
MPEIEEVNLKNTTLYSEEVQDIINRPPNAIIRWGLTVFFGLCLMCIFLMYWIQYPDILKASFRLTSEQSPKSILAKIEGRLIKLHIKNQEQVTKNQVLGYIESTTDHEQALSLLRFLDTFEENENLFLQNKMLDFKRLGELQSSFQAFKAAYLQYISFLSGGFYLQKKALLLQDLTHLKSLEQNLQTQKKIQTQDYTLAEKEFKIQEKLYADKVIPTLEFTREESKMMSKKMPLQQLESSLINNLTSQIGKQKEILELDKTISEQKSIFFEALKTLQSNLYAWQQKYVLIAPIVGKLHFSTFLQEKQMLQTGQELFWISTENQETYGELYIPQFNFGKVKVGQEVNIKFNAYPFQEFGMVKGKIEFIAEIPIKDSIFLAKVILPKGLTTNYNKKIVYQSKMTATADIITQKNRLIDKLFYQWRKLWER